MALKQNSLDVRVICFFAGLFLYALGSSPTPDSLGASEYLIAFLLLLSVTSQSLLSIFKLKFRNDGKDKLLSWFLMCSKIVFLAGLIIPTVMGIWSGNAFHNILRDLVAWVFLFLPLFFYNSFHTRINHIALLLFGVLTIGIGFALRVFLPAFVYVEGLSLIHI